MSVKIDLPDSVMEKLGLGASTQEPSTPPSVGPNLDLLASTLGGGLKPENIHKIGQFPDFSTPVGPSVEPSLGNLIPSDVHASSGEGDRILINAGPSRAGWHSVESYMRCKYLYGISSLLGWQLGSREALVRGSLIHVGLAHHYIRWEIQKRGQMSYRPEDGSPEVFKHADAFYTPKEAMRQAVLREEDSGDKALGEKLLSLCCEILDIYQRHYRSRDNFRVVEIEEEHEAMIDGKWLHTARLDMVIEDVHGIWIMDHKTSARLRTNLDRKKAIARYALSGQVHGWHHFGRNRWGHRYKGAMINLVPSIMPIKPAMFTRGKPPMAPWMTQRLVEVLRQVKPQIEETKRKFKCGELDPHTDLLPTPSEFTCMTPYGECHAAPICRHGINGLEARKASMNARPRH